MRDILRRLLQRRRAARELDDELAFHVEMETEANIARGMPPAEARHRALADFGGIAQTRETVRDVRRLPIESIWQDVRYAVRVLAASRAFAFGAAGTLALAIGVATAMFTVVDALVLRPVPFREPEQLANLVMGTDRGGTYFVAPPVLRAWRESPAVEAAESARPTTALVEIGDAVVTRGLATVTPGVFSMLGGVRPVAGRLFSATEGAPGQDDVVLVSEALWRSSYAGDSGLLGRPIIVDGERLTVVGILPSAFRFPSASTMLWRPTNLLRDGERARAYVRFAPGVPRDDALRLATEAARRANPKIPTLRAWAYPMAGLEEGYSHRALPLLAGAVALLFLVLCANVCGLLLARLTARRREFSTRAALGAARGRLFRQALVESGLLAAVGALAGVGVAWALVSLARTLIPQQLLAQTLNPLDLDGRALAVTSVAGLAAALGAGLLPAWLGTRLDAGESMRIVDRGGTDSRAARTLVRALLTAEVALVCALLAAATLLTRSFVNLSYADRGLETSGVTTVWLNVGATAPDEAARDALARTLDEELRQLPGVRQVAWSYGVPPGGGVTFTEDWISDLPGAPRVNASVYAYIVSPEFFSIYRIPILRGRTFTSADARTSVIVSEHLAQALWPGHDPIGRTFAMNDARFRVVGLAREIHYPSIDSRKDLPEFYWPYQVDSNPMISLRCATECPDGAVIRHRLAATQPGVRVARAVPVERYYSAELDQPRAAAALAAAFAFTSLVAAAGGLFSVLSYAVSRRRREFGIRAALGASPSQLRRVILRDGLGVTAAGLAIGSGFALLLSGMLSSLQYGVTASDPLSLGIVVATIAVTAGAAAWRPARTAARIDPAELLREP